MGLCPKPVKRFARRWFSHKYDAYNRRKWRAMDPFGDIEEVSTYPSKVDIRLGIIKEFAHSHKDYVSACRDLGVPYRVLDISGPDWVDVVRNSGCDAFLVRPSCELSIWKRMYDERLRVMVEDMGKIIYPSYDELWFYESKRRMCWWLQAHDIPHPKTWIFYNCDEALTFARNTELPIIFKSDFGSGASGVKIFRSRSRLIRWIKLYFRRGAIRKDEDPRDRQWGSVLLQEYLPDVAEWRMRRIGDSYFGTQKLKVGEFHSGTGVDVWYDPPRRLLEFTRELTEASRFRSMSLDIFETLDGEYLVNELQSVFGTNRPYEMLVNGKPGRYLYDHNARSWHFEEGIFCQNGSCNLRVADLLGILGASVALPRVEVSKMMHEGDLDASQRDYAVQASRRPNNSSY